MAGKDVPHRKPAKTVKSAAFFLVSAETWFRKNYTFLFNSVLRTFLRLLPQNMPAQSSTTLAIYVEISPIWLVK
jgi:hypothetical protein